MLGCECNCKLKKGMLEVDGRSELIGDFDPCPPKSDEQMRSTVRG